MKVLLSVLIILNLIVIWFFIIKGNVRFSFGADKKDTSRGNHSTPN